MTREEALSKAIMTLIYFQAHFCKSKEAVDHTQAIIDTLEQIEQEPCGDVISRQSIKQKLQEHHDFFVNAYGGFSNLPQSDKSRVDEITNCIAMVVNEPPVNPQEPKTGHWIPVSEGLPEFHKDVLLSLRSLDIEVGFRAETEPYFYCHGDYIEPQNVLAWQPKPKPYKLQESEEQA